MSKILIDGRFIGVGESISRYTLEIVQGILALDSENQYTLLIRPQGVKIIGNWKLEIGNLHLKVLDIPHYSFDEQTKLLKYLNQEKFDLVHFTQFNHPIRYRGKFIITIHDLTLLGHLYRMGPLKRISFKTVMNSAVKNSERIITDSITSKKDLIDTYKINPDKITVVYLATDRAFNARVKSEKLKVKSFKEKYHTGENYLLYTGMWKRHKNLIRLLKAYEILVEKGRNNTDQHGSDRQIPQLVLVGKIDKNEPEVLSEISRINLESPKKPKSDPSTALRASKLQPIVTTGFIDEEELPIAYAGALTYIIPSLSEGFGLPPLEAMACGTAVISSNVQPMPEILGDVPLYFDPYDENDIAKKMEEIVSNKKLREEMAEKGPAQAAKYRWDKTAKKTLEVYKSVL